MNYLSLDLEMNHDDDGKTAEVIQVGYVIGDGVTGDVLVEVRRYVKNHLTRPIKPFITTLTGITDEDIQTHGRTLDDIYLEMTHLAKQYEVFINPITWGGGDSQELREAIIAEDPSILKDRYLFGRRWIDVKTLYVMDRMSNGNHHQGGLKKACNNLGITFVGPAHDATQDALNTFKVFHYYMKQMKR